MTKFQNDFISNDSQIIPTAAIAKSLNIETKKVSYYSRTKKDFPQGKIINKRRYFSLNEIEKMKEFLKNL